MNYFCGVRELRFGACLPSEPFPPTPMPLTAAGAFCTVEDDYAITLAALLTFWLLRLAPRVPARACCPSEFYPSFVLKGVPGSWPPSSA